MSEHEDEERERALAREVGRDPRLGNTARLIFMLLAATDTGLSREALGRRVSRSGEAIDTGLAELEAAGYLTRAGDLYDVSLAAPAAGAATTLLEAAAATVRPDRRLSPTAKLVGMELADSADKAPGRELPSVAVLAERFGMEAVAIEEGIDELFEHGYLEHDGPDGYVLNRARFGEGGAG